MGMEERGKIADVDYCECGLCASYTPPAESAAVLLVIDDDDDDDEQMLFEVTLCDSCRRALCTCSYCTAWTPPDPHVEMEMGECCAGIPASIVVGDDVIDDFTAMKPVSWCRDGFVQKEPYTLSEIRQILGGGLVAELNTTTGSEETVKAAKPGNSNGYGSN